MDNKAAFIDVDGTMTRDLSSWEKVHNFFGERDASIIEQMERNTELFFEGKINYHEWATLDVALWEGYPITDLHEALLPPVLIDNAAKGVNMLKKNGFDVVLISGGIDIMVNEVANIVGADEAYSNTIHHDNGVINGKVTIGVSNKKSVVQQVSSKNKYNLNQSIAIGDNFNDVDMFEMVGYSVALNSTVEELLRISSTQTESEDFAEVAHMILNNHE